MVTCVDFFASLRAVGAGGRGLGVSWTGNAGSRFNVLSSLTIATSGRGCPWRLGFGLGTKTGDGAIALGVGGIDFGALGSKGIVAGAGEDICGSRTGAGTLGCSASLVAGRLCPSSLPARGGVSATAGAAAGTLWGTACVGLWLIARQANNPAQPNANAPITSHIHLEVTRHSPA